MKFFKDELLLKQRLDSGDSVAKRAFDKLIERFGDDDCMEFSNHVPTIYAVYCDPGNPAAWKVAADSNVSSRTLNRYRHNYVRWFRYYIDKQTALAEVAATR